VVAGLVVTMAVLASLGVRRMGLSFAVRRLGRSLDVRGLGPQRRLGFPGRNNRITSLKVFAIFPSLEVQRLKITSIERRVGTSLEIQLEKLAGRQVVVDFTSLNVESGLTSVGGSKCGGTEEGDSKESDFRSVLHDVLVIRGLRTRLELEEEVM